MDRPDVSVVVVSYNTCGLLSACLRSVEETSQQVSCETIVVDNASSDGSGEMVEREFPHCRLLRNGSNLGFARATNQGIALSRGRYILLLNSDAVLLPGALASMVCFLDTHPRVGTVGVQLLNPDGSFQASYADFPSLLGEILLLTRLAGLFLHPSYPSYPAELSQKEREVDWVFGACLMVRREVVEQVGVLDEDYFMYSEETDWCFRMRRAGWLVYYLPTARAVHWSGQSSWRHPERRRSLLYRSKHQFFRKHRGALVATAFYGALAAASVLKLGYWALAAFVGRSEGRERAWLNVRSYALLLREL